MKVTIHTEALALAVAECFKSLMLRSSRRALGLLVLLSGCAPSPAPNDVPDAVAPAEAATDTSADTSAETTLPDVPSTDVPVGDTAREMAPETSVDVATTETGSDASAEPAIEAGNPDASDVVAMDTSMDVSETGSDGGGMDVADTGTTDVVETDASTTTWCSMGSDVPGITVPTEFCIRRYAMVRSPRTMLVAPNGDLFVATPSQGAPGGSVGGPASILVYSDDNRDGVPEVSSYVTRVPDVHGIALGGGFLYWTTQSDVFRTPYATGQRMETAGMREPFRLPMEFMRGERWTHGLARSAGGTLYASRGEYGTCGIGMTANRGGIYSVGPSSRFETIANGFRNPMYMRCHPVAEVCLAAELGEDQTMGAVEKILQIRPMTEYGYPCCHRNGVANFGNTNPDRCLMVTTEERSFPIGDTPFGLDWERGTWPEPYRRGLFVAMHGSFYTTPRFLGAGIRYVPTNETTHLPSGEFSEFLRGAGEFAQLQRPADVAFAPDGRLFVADDVGGGIYWIAPRTLRRP